MIITTAQVHSTKPELRSRIRDGEDLLHWSRLEIRLDTFRWSTIPQKQLTIIITIIIVINCFVFFFYLEFDRCPFCISLEIPNIINM